MAKFIFFTDSHVAGGNPRHRIDDFPRAIIAKINETYRIAKEMGCDFVLFGGDMWNFHRVFSFEVISELMDAMCESGVTTYAVIGEHDIYGHNLDTYASSTMAFVAKRCPSLVVLWEPVEIGDIALYGKHEPDKMEDVVKIKTNPDKVNVLVCHELITNTVNPYGTISTDIFVDSGFDLVVSGDLHDGYPTHRVGKTWLCNPGSLARRSISEANRWPQIAIISVEKGKDPIIEMRRIKCAKSGDEVFDKSIIEVVREGKSDPSAFAQEMIKFEAESTDIFELARRAGEKSGVREEVLRYIESKRVPVPS
jgi:exonuclease SbcD